MIQLKCYQSVDDQQANINPVFLDLYDVEPIKLTLSIEDITNADASSVFSKQFKVPASRNNNEFFLNAFEIDGIDFDVTTKKPAEILVDGAEFRQGHIRLQKIFTNADKDRIDYELLFLGETRDFSSVIGDARMCDLNLDTIAPIGNTYTMAEVEESWKAYPSTVDIAGTSITPSTTNGYSDGDVIFPLVDHGALYNEDGTPATGFNQIALGPANSGAFNHHNHPISATRFKPMIRAKYIIDQIFANAGYSYESDFFDTDLFKQIYVSAFGNNANISIEIEQSTALSFNAYDNFNQNSGNLTLTQIFQNPGGNFSPYQGSPYFGSTFSVAAPSTVGGAYYTFNAHAYYEGYDENSDGSQFPVFARLVMIRRRAGVGTVVARTTGFNAQTRNLTFDTRVTTSVWNAAVDTLQTGDVLTLAVEPDFGSPQNEIVNNAMWECVASPGGYYPARDLDCDYKQVDFIKDILTSFRLVLAPKNGKPNTFIIEPWQDYIGSGTTYDWSKKLCEEKDMVIEPLFNTQSETIEFTLTADTDWINDFHQKDFNKVHGFLRYDSNNELLKGKRDIKVSYSPTPVYQIEQYVSGQHPAPEFIIPYTHKHENEGPVTQHQPIKPITRLLFYNGLQPITDSNNYWFSSGMTVDSSGSGGYEWWPLMSMYSEWVANAGPTETSVKLEWSNDIRYFNPIANYNEIGNTLYDQYWSRYINSLYNKFSRRVTAYFTLNNVDLQYFSFDDIIFVNGKYYRPEKIIDVQIGATTEVQVQLITLKDQRPIWLNEPLTGFSVATFNNNCAGSQGSIQITTNGTPNFTWELVDSGATGVHNATAGQAPYTFIITAPVGVDTLIVTDSLGRTAEIQVEVPASTATPITATSIKVDPTICSGDESLCNGGIVVSPIGGSGNYTVTWTDPSIPDGANPTNLCEGIYAYQVIDNVTGCESAFYEVRLECNAPGPTAWKLQSCTQPADPGHPNATRYTVLDPSLIPPAPLTQLQPGMVLDDGDDADQYGPCYEVIGYEYTEVPNFNYVAVFDNCATCAGGVQTYTYEYELCSDPTTIGIASTAFNTWAYGTVVKLEESDVCVVIRFPSTLTPNAVINDSASYENCDACNGITPPALQVCHTITATTAISYTYEFDNQSYIGNLGANQVAAFCAVEGTAAINSGTGTIEISENECVSSRSCTLPSPTICVTNFGASMAPCIGGTLDEYMEGWVDLSAPTPTDVTFRLVVGWLEGLNGNCSNVQYIQDLYVDIEAGQSYGLLTCNNGAPFISSSGATICSVQLIETPYPECNTPEICNEYTIGGFDIGETIYLDCDGIQQTASYNGPAASGFDAETFCATEIVEVVSGSQPSLNGPCPY